MSWRVICRCLPEFLTLAVAVVVVVVVVVVVLQNVNICNFAESFSDGLAFCALLHHFIPEEIPFNTLNSASRVGHGRTRGRGWGWGAE
jgi:hypothetical protein